MSDPVEAAIDTAVAALHAHPAKVYAIATGAGAGFLELLWRTAGASRTLLGFQFPYDAHVFDQLVTRPPASYSSVEAAIALAAAAYFQGQQALAAAGDLSAPLLGLGLTAAVATDRTRRGDDRVHLALRANDGLWALTARFDNTRLTRAAEGRLCDVLALNALLHATGIAQVAIDASAVESDAVTATGHLTPSPLPPPPLPATLPALVQSDGRVEATATLAPHTHIIFSGSFAPLHAGHDAIAAWVQAATGQTVVCELAAANADKSAVSRATLAARAAQFRGRWPVLVAEGTALFVDKARHYPGCGFILGVDTVVRLLDPKYYGGPAGLDAALTTFRALGTHFYVCDRAQDGERLTLDQLTLPAAAAGLFTRVPLRIDISSTALRVAAGQ